MARIIAGMRMSISVPAADADTLDEYVRTHPGHTRSSALQVAIGMLREQSLTEQYDLAMDEWAESGQAADWDVAVADSIGPEQPAS